MTSESPVPVRRAVSLPRWFFISIVSVQILTFACGLIYLMLGGAGAMDNKFRDEALDKFWAYLIRVNLEVLKGYAIVAVMMGLVAWPAVKWMLRRNPQPGRWSILWRTFFVCGIITLLFALRLPYDRPHLMDGLGEGHFLLWLRDHIPSVVRDRIFPAFLDILPWAAGAGLAFFYLNAVLRLCAPQWPAGMRRTTAFAKLCVIAIICWGLPSFNSNARHAPRTDKRPNVLIIATDSLRADHLSINGYHRLTSPNIDLLAKESVNFTKCFTPIASTVESLTSMNTSQYPHTHGLQHMFPNRGQVDHVMSSSPALARIMRDGGYDTMVMGDWCAGVYELLKLGYERIDATTFDNFKTYMSQAVYMAHPVMPLYFDNPLGYWLFPKLESSAFFVTPDVVTERVVDRLSKQAKSEKPFFWKVFYSCTHIPYTNPPEFAKKFTDPKYKGEHKNAFHFDVNKWITSIDMADKWRTTQKDDVEQIIGLYDGGVAKFDDCVRRVVEQLKATGQYENTIILITSDHGDDLFEPNCTFGHGISFNGGDQNNNIPCILRVPGLKDKPHTVSKIVRSLDFAPTLLDLCGLKPDPRMEGVSLRPYLERTTEDMGLAFFGETSYLFCRRYIPGEKPLYTPPMVTTTFIDESFDCHFVLKDEFQPRVIQTKERCLRTEKWKFVFTPGEDYPILRLYDLENDPQCLKNVALVYPEVFSEMERRLMAWMREKKESRIPEIFPKGEPVSRRPSA